jgi:CMP/dCMP kinase
MEDGRTPEFFMQDRVIAIDGPAGSGKSTAAHRLALALGFTHLNTGAMYRAVAFVAGEGGISLHGPAVVDVARQMKFHYDIHDGEQRFFVNSVDRTDSLFTASLTEQLKPVVNNTDVRKVLVDKMREAVKEFLALGVKGVVMEGRDIGTVVFPDAALKFYIHADLNARTERRAAELKARNEIVDFDGLKKQIQYRDETDKARTVGALIQAADAIDIDTTHLDEEAVLKRLLDEVRKRKMA